MFFDSFETRNGIDIPFREDLIHVPSDVNLELLQSLSVAIMAARTLVLLC